MTEPLDLTSNYTGGDYLYKMGGDGFTVVNGKKQIDCSHMVNLLLKGADYNIPYEETRAMENSTYYTTVLARDVKRGDIALWINANPNSSGSPLFHTGIIEDFNPATNSGHIFGAQTSTGPARVVFGPRPPSYFWPVATKFLRAKEEFRTGATPAATPAPAAVPAGSVQQINFQFPIRKPDGSHYQLEELYKALEQETSGHYLLGNHGFWHGGIHISEKSAPQCKHKEPVRCIADGEVVAYRLNNSYLTSTFQGDSECTHLQYSTSFCLVRHQYESPKRAPASTAEAKPATAQPETNTLSFFSLYMHLLPYEQYPSKENPANRRLTIKASDLNVRQEANLTGEPLGHITSGAEVEVLSSSTGYRKQPADTTTYELAQVKILSKEVKKAGQQTAKIGDIVWLALNKSEAGKPVQHYAKERRNNTLARPSYWKGQVKARLTKRIPAFKNATDDDNQQIGLLAENSVLAYHTSTLKRVTRNGQPQLMAKCSIISGGLWDKPFCPATIWVVIDTATAELTPDAPSDFDSVVIGAIPIKAGDPIGYLGLYETPRSVKGGKNSLHQVHVEVFTDDAKLESFLKNPAGISTGRKYVRASQGKPLYNKTGTEQQPIFTASGQLLRENYCAAQEQVKLLKGSDGKEWYCLNLNTGSTADAYIAKPDAEIISQHDWEKLGFQIIKETNDNADGFLDPESTPEFYQTLYQQIDQLGNQDGEVTPDEIARALKDHALRDRWAKLIAYHPTEWQAKSDEPKWQKMNELLKDSPELLRHEKERIDNLVFWDEMSRAMQVGLPKQIYHFHPIAFISNLQTDEIRIEEARVRAFLRMIRVGEGTAGHTGYEKLFGGSSFIKNHGKNFDDHPQIKIANSGYTSSAAGAYQVMGYTWSDLSMIRAREKYKIKSFNPESQDRFCIVLLKHKVRNNALSLIINNDIKLAIENCSWEWASLPPGRYGQPIETMNQALANYQRFFDEEIEGKSDLSLSTGFLKEFESA